MNTQLPLDPPEKFEQEARLTYPGHEVDKNAVRPDVQKSLGKIPPPVAYKNTASNFYWIAGLSLVNSLIAIFGGSVNFPVGLAATQIVDAFALAFGEQMPEARMIFVAISLVINIIVCGLIVVFGYLISKGSDWPLITGMVLYALDAVLMLAFQDWIGAGFHAYFLFLIWAGFSAIRQWKKTNARGQDSFPKNIGVS